MGFIRKTEAMAARIRLFAGVGVGRIMDPEQLASRMGIEIPDLLTTCSPELIEELRRKVTPKNWSGAYLPIPDRPGVIVLHPDNTLERRRVTVMEEIVHPLLGHKPTKLIPVAEHFQVDGYDDEIESEARTVAAACLVPRAELQSKVNRWTGEEIATYYRVSIALVEFRAKTCGFWRLYRRSAQ